MGKARRPFIQAAIVSILSPERLPSISWCSLWKDGVGIYVISPPLPSMHLVSPYQFARVIGRDNACRVLPPAQTWCGRYRGNTFGLEIDFGGSTVRRCL